MLVDERDKERKGEVSQDHDGKKGGEAGVVAHRQFVEGLGLQQCSGEEGYVGWVAGRE